MSKFADTVEYINPEVLAGVSGGIRMVELAHDATVGGIANVVRIDSDYSSGQTEYEAVVDGGPGNANNYVKLSENQFNADIADVYQHNNVEYDMTLPDPPIF
jgi:hypothetical protein